MGDAGGGVTAELDAAGVELGVNTGVAPGVRPLVLAGLRIAAGVSCKTSEPGEPSSTSKMGGSAVADIIWCAPVTSFMGVCIVAEVETPACTPSSPAGRRGATGAEPPIPARPREYDGTRSTADAKPLILAEIVRTTLEAVLPVAEPVECASSPSLPLSAGKWRASPGDASFEARGDMDEVRDAGTPLREPRAANPGTLAKGVARSRLNGGALAFSCCTVTGRAASAVTAVGAAVAGEGGTVRAGRLVAWLRILRAHARIA